MHKKYVFGRENNNMRSFIAYLRKVWRYERVFRSPRSKKERQLNGRKKKKNIRRNKKLKIEQHEPH